MSLWIVRCGWLAWYMREIEGCAAAVSSRDGELAASLPDEEILVLEGELQHAVEALCLVLVAVNAVLDLLWGVSLHDANKRRGN